MMRPVRMLAPDSIYFITNRCVDEQFFLNPTKNTEQLIGAWLGRTLARYKDDITLYGFVFMSNHFHLLIKDKRGMIPQFMWYFQTNLAKALNKEWGRHGGSIFARRYDAAVVADDKNVLGRLVYTLGNAVKAGLVEKSSQWPGLSSYGASIKGEKLEFKQLNATKYQLACMAKGVDRVNKDDYIETYPIPITVPDCIADDNKEIEQNRIKELLSEFERQHAIKRKDSGKSVLGLTKILEGQFTDRPQNPSYSPRVIIFCADKLSIKEYYEVRSNFTAAYREASADFKNATRRKKRSMAQWPDYSCPPLCINPIGYEEAA
jgi:REP element-mobilizing transposase RayT